MNYFVFTACLVTSLLACPKICNLQYSPVCGYNNKDKTTKVFGSICALAASNECDGTGECLTKEKNRKDFKVHFNPELLFLACVIEYGVPQISVLGPLLFLIYKYVLLYFSKTLSHLVKTDF